MECLPSSVQLSSPRKQQFHAWASEFLHQTPLSLRNGSDRKRNVISAAAADGSSSWATSSPPKIWTPPAWRDPASEDLRRRRDQREALIRLKLYASMPCWMTMYLTRIINSKVYDVAIESPLELAPKLSERLGNKLLLKGEDMQPGVGSAARRLKCDAVIAMPVTTPEIKWKSVKRLGATVVRLCWVYTSCVIDVSAGYHRQGKARENKTAVRATGIVPYCKYVAW
ncbi:hypothetical protein R1sor_012769 [Riccia sorocarpa]|uniref:Uncharacterized protein n=1 Tax=Riccia sorocarpa TaxID=122646 RepID=A0ABD3I531_9MARC